MFNPKKLKVLEDKFLADYPGGFAHPEIVAIAKKHKMEKMVEKTQAFFSPEACSNSQLTLENMIKIIGQASMVSVFEKPKFRDFARRLSRDEAAFLTESLSELLHGNQAKGFTGMVDLMATEKLAKWSLVSIIPAYYSPDIEVFVKPTTAKRVLSYFEMSDPIYKPHPSWDFYQKYRDLINEAKTKVSSSLSPSNAAFSGFLMMTLPN